MQITSRYTVALHTMLAIAYYSDKKKVTSTFLAKSIGADATIIRHILTDLKKAGFVNVRAGVGGASLSKSLSDITMLDIFQTIVVIEDCMFKFYENPNAECSIGQNIYEILGGRLSNIQQAMYEKMKIIFTNPDDLKNFKYIKIFFF